MRNDRDTARMIVISAGTTIVVVALAFGIVYWILKSRWEAFKDSVAKQLDPRSWFEWLTG